MLEPSMNLDALATQAARIADALCVADGMGSTDIVESRRSLIEDMASHVQAETIGGALFQVALAWQAAECVASWLPDDKSTVRPHDANEQLRRLLFSIRVLLEKLGGEPMHPRISGFYMPARDNPLTMVDEALAAVDVGEARP